MLFAQHQSTRKWVPHSSRRSVPRRVGKHNSKRAATCHPQPRPAILALGRNAAISPGRDQSWSVNFIPRASCTRSASPSRRRPTTSNSSSTTSKPSPSFLANSSPLWPRTVPATSRPAPTRSPPRLQRTNLPSASTASKAASSPIASPTCLTSPSAAPSASTAPTASSHSASTSRIRSGGGARSRL